MNAKKRLYFLGSLAILIFLGALSVRIFKPAWLGLSDRLHPRRMISSSGDPSSQTSTDSLTLKRMMLEQSVLSTTKDGLVINLGQIVLADEQGQNIEGLCDTYSSIEIHLRATGVAINGRSPRIEVRSPCQGDVGQVRLNPITVPLRRLITLEPMDRLLDDDLTTQSLEPCEAITEGRQTPDGYLMICDLAGEWFTDWTVTRIHFHHRADHQLNLDIDEFEISSVKEGGWNTPWTP